MTYDINQINSPSILKMIIKKQEHEIEELRYIANSYRQICQRAIEHEREVIEKIQKHIDER